MRPFGGLALFNENRELSVGEVTFPRRKSSSILKGFKGLACGTLKAKATSSLALSLAGEAVAAGLKMRGSQELKAL